MAHGNIIEERITFTSGDLTLTGVMAYPACTDPQFAMLICSPHPHFAGDMDNNVIRHLARDLAANAVTLRFDYRGVGESEIALPADVSVFDYWDSVDQQKDYADALADVASAAAVLAENTGGMPMAVAGYSFGAAVGLRYARADDNVYTMVGISPPWTRIEFDFLADCSKPSLLISGKDDFLYCARAIANVQAMAGPNLTIDLQESADHFFRGREHDVSRRVGVFLQDVLSRQNGVTTDAL